MSEQSIVEFIEARLAEREAAAKACAEAYPSPWEVSDRGHSATVRADEPNFHTIAALDQYQVGTDRWLGEYLEHIAFHDPAYVLADIQAKRRILERHGGRHLCEDGMAGERWDDDAEDFVGWPCDDARDLAAPFAAHEAYNPRWKLSADDDRWALDTGGAEQ